MVVGLRHGLCRFQRGVKAQQPVWLVVRIVQQSKAKLGQKGLQGIAQGAQLCAALAELRLGALHGGLGCQAVFHGFEGFAHGFGV